MSASDCGEDDSQLDFTSNPATFLDSDMNYSDISALSDSTLDLSVLSLNQRVQISENIQGLGPSSSYHISQCPLSDIPSIDPNGISGNISSPHLEPLLMVSPSVSAPMETYVDIPSKFKKLESILQNDVLPSIAVEVLKQYIDDIYMYSGQTHDSYVLEYLDGLKSRIQAYCKKWCEEIVSRCDMDYMAVQQRNYESFEALSLWMDEHVGKDLENPYNGISDYIDLTRKCSIEQSQQYSITSQIEDILSKEDIFEGKNVIWAPVQWSKEKQCINHVDRLFTNGSHDVSEHDAQIKRWFQDQYGNVGLALSKMEQVSSLQQSNTHIHHLPKTASSNGQLMSTSKTMLSNQTISGTSTSTNKSLNNHSNSIYEEDSSMIDPTDSILDTNSIPLAAAAWKQTPCICQQKSGKFTEFLIPPKVTCQYCMNIQVVQKTNNDVVYRSPLGSILSTLDILENETRSRVSEINEDSIESLLHGKLSHSGKQTNSGISTKIDLVIEHQQSIQPQQHADLDRCKQALFQMHTLHTKLKTKLASFDSIECNRCVEQINYFVSCERSVVSGTNNIHAVFTQYQITEKYSAILRPLLEFQKISSLNEYIVHPCLDTREVTCSLQPLLPSVTQFIQQEQQHLILEFQKYSNTIHAVVQWLQERRRSYNAGLRLAFSRYQALMKISQLEQVEVQRRKEYMHPEALPAALRPWNDELSQVNFLPPELEGSSNQTVALQRTKRSNSMSVSRSPLTYGNQTPNLGSTPILGTPILGTPILGSHQPESMILGDTPRLMNSPRGNPFSPHQTSVKPGASPIPSPFNLNTSNINISANNNLNSNTLSNMSIPLLGGSGIITTGNTTPHSFGSTQSYIPSNRTQQQQARSLMHNSKLNDLE